MPQETNLHRILDSLKKGGHSPFYLICGEDDFLVNDAVHKITDLLLPPEGRDLNLFIIDGEIESPEAVREAALTPSLIGGHKVIVVQNAGFLRPSTPLPQAITKILSLLESDPAKAVRHFVAFLKKTGWTLDDLRNGSWKQIPDPEWKKVLNPEDFEQREKWLPRIIELCDQYGLIAEDTGGGSGLEEILRQGIPEGNCLILTSSVVDRRKSLFKFFAESGVVLDFPSDKADRYESRKKELAGAVSRDILSRSGKRLSAGALEALGRKTGFNLQKMAGELEKLAAYSGDKTAIEESDIEAVVNGKPEDSVFSLTGAISSRDSAKAVMVLQDLLDQGLHPLMLFTMMAREIRLLLYAKMLLQSEKLRSFHPAMEYPQFQKTVYPAIKELMQSGKIRGELAGSHPYALFNCLKNSTRFTRDECINYLERLLETDLALKSTGQDPRVLLKRLLIEFGSERILFKIPSS